MMEQKVSTVIDPELCVGCGLCVRVCPTGTISMQDGKAAVTGNWSLNCGHCAAVCPVEAIRVTSLDDTLTDFISFEAPAQWQPPGEFDTGKLVNLMASRRSCRNYRDEPVDRSLLEDLVKIGVTAPSGTNSQLWTFTILPNRAAVMALAEPVGAFLPSLEPARGKTLGACAAQTGRAP